MTPEAGGEQGLAVKDQGAAGIVPVSKTAAGVSMRDRRSSLESMNAGRRRRSGVALDELDYTLDRLEGRLDRSSPRETLYERQPRRREIARERFHERAAPAYGDVAGGMHELREDLRQQISAELHSEFAALTGEIGRALKNSAPASQTADLNAEFERLSAMMHRLSEQSDDRQAHMLRLEREDMKKALDLLAREDTVRSFDRRWGELDRRFSEMAGRLAAPRPAAADPALRTLASRIEEIGGAVAALPNSGALRSLEDKMRMLQGAVDRFSRQQEQPGKGMLDAIEERLDELSRAVAVSVSQPRAAAFDPEPFERLEARISSLARQIGEATQQDATRDLSDQLAALSHRVEDLAHRIDLPEHAIERLAGQIGSIAERLDHAPALPNLDTVFHGLENRIASMASLLEQRHEDALAHGRALFRDLETRIDDVAARIDTERPASGSDDQFIAAMDARFAELAAHFERQVAATPKSDDDALRNLEDRLERRLDTISSRIESSAGAAAVDTDLIRSLEAQIAGLAEHISRPAAPRENDDIQPRLDRIEQSIAGSRNDVLEAARRAAEEAVRNFSGNAAEGELVAGLADDLKSLEALTRRSDDRNAKTFEAIHDTLLKIVDRLGAIEKDRAMPPAAPTPKPAPAREMVLETARTPSLAPADEMLTPAAIGTAEAGEPAAGRTSLLGGLARALSRSGKAGAQPVSEPAMADAAEAVTDGEAPSIELDPPYDPGLANQPLEPGSGGPDLNAIMRRVRDERARPVRGAAADASRADFIAAARRAAQAAAAEAGTMKSRQAAGTEKEKTGAGSFFRNRRKPLLMGAAAILIALAALQGSRMFLSGNSGPQQAAAPAPAAIAALSEEDVGSADAPVETSAQAVRMAGETSVADDVAPVRETAVAEDDWLDMETTSAAPAEQVGIAPEPATPIASPDEMAEVEILPEPDTGSLAAIPLDAGPVVLREAAAAGDPKAFYEIGNRYAEGRGVAEDMAKAAEWYEKAAGQGLAPAQYRLGSFYEKGIGVSRDIAAAKRWYERAAGHGNASAMHNLAVLHAMGADGATDNDAAARWFQRAAEFGVRDSQFNLGILAAKGVGMPQNLEEAYKWFTLVARAGDKDAADKRDEIARALRPEQLETARAAAELWRAKDLDAEANAVEIPESWSESQATTASIDMRAAVRNIQQILNAGNYDAGAEDGLMGQKTRSAIAAFQKDNGMKATGEVDEALVRALLEKR